MSRTITGVLAGAVVAATAVTLSLTTGAGAATPAASEESTTADGFSQCMRDHGVTDFPDVTVTDDGRVVLDPDGTGVDVFSEIYREAREACADQLSDGAALPSVPEPDVSSATPMAPPSPGDGKFPPTAPAGPELPSVPSVSAG